MGPIRSYQPGKLPSRPTAGPRRRAPRSGRPSAERPAGSFRPRLEILENRELPGDTVLGLWTLALWGPGLASADPPFEAPGAEHARAWRPGLGSTLGAAGSLSRISILEDSRAEGKREATVGDGAATAVTFGSARLFDRPVFADDTLAWQVAVHRVSALAFPTSEAAAADIAGTPAGVGRPWSDASASFFALAFAGNEERAGRSPGLLATPRGGSAPLSFDAPSGQLAIRADAGNHTVREALAADGFVEVTLDGQRHSSNPRSASFDSALAGATGATLAGIHFDGGGQDTLILGSQHLAGGFTVQAAGATVVTQDVVTAGPLAIQAPNITVSGAVQGGTVVLAAADWVTVDAAGRIDAAQGASGGRIEVTAGVFVNSGQLHADGPTGRQILVHAGNVLNAGPLTADSTGLGESGGQVRIAFTGAYVATTAAVISASSVAGPGGHLTIDGVSSGHLFSSGRHLVTGSVGGAVDLFGRDVVLAGATIDASGETDGGSVRIGGDFQGRNPAVVNAQTVTVTPATTIRANAQQLGSGGRVIVWADHDNTFDGVVSARGGSAGGFIEVSGKGSLSYQGTADAGASIGKAGTLLLDPKNLVIADAPDGVFPQFDLIDPHPTPGSHFGFRRSMLLSNGNVFVANPYDDFGDRRAGAVYLFDGSSGALLSSLVGSHPNDQVGSYGITLLNTGNYVVHSRNWDENRGAATWGSATGGVSGPIDPSNSLVGLSPDDDVGNSIIPLNNGNYVVNSPRWNGNRGAVTWGDGITGIAGTVDASNSLVGTNPNDYVGSNVTLLSNGNYVAQTSQWNGRRGAATWESGTGGIRGPVDASNSLVGSDPNDQVGYYVTPLSNGNYVVESPFWNGSRGAATWGNGATGISGPVDASNSLVGSNPDDLVGRNGAARLSNGNYVVRSPYWNGQRGAATWGDGGAGVRGTVSDANSLVGSNPGDRVGSDAFGITILGSGNYVVRSPYWNGQRGAATWGNGATGVSGPVDASNSLVGSSPGDFVGSVTPLNNGNYVVGSSSWNGRRGAVTWGSGTSGVSGLVDAGNSLVGANPDDLVAWDYIWPLDNGNYVVNSPRWNGTRGAVTWGDGTTGVRGLVDASNSLIGVNPGDSVGSGRPIPLANGNYVVSSPFWDGTRGAATWGSGTTGIAGFIDASNSLIGSNPGDQVAFNGGVTRLSNGNYVVSSRYWNGTRGAVTWGNGTSGVSGPVDAGNSLVGSDPNDQVGSYGSVTALSNGNYLVNSPAWNSQRGAVTWGSGTSGISGLVDAGKSLVGSNPRDQIGYDGAEHFHGITILSNGNYVVKSPNWNGQRGSVTWGSGTSGVNGPVDASNSLVGVNPSDRVGASDVALLSNGNYVVQSSTWNGGRGAATWVSGTSGQTLDGLSTITPQNSLVGRAANAGLSYVIDNPIAETFLAAFVNEGDGRVTAGFTGPNQLTYPTGQAQSLTVTPAFLTRTLNTGTAVVLQASNDITVNSPIIVDAGGNGGALTLQAGRSVVLNAGIVTDGGALTLIANDTLANGVVDTQRDPGQAVLSMAPGTELDTGSAPLTIELRDGAGLSNPDSGAITLQTLTAGAVSVANNGPSAGSDVNLGPVTTSGAQNYANPNGTTTVTGNLTATDNPITFNHAVVLNAGLTFSTGSSTVNFAGGTVAPSPGVVTVAGSIVLTGSTTFSATLNGTDPGRYSQFAAGGSIDLGGSTLSLALGFEPPVGSTFEILANTGVGPIGGTFDGLDEGATFNQGGFVFQITYQGGTGGNSVVLTRLE